MKKSKLGRAIRATAQNARAAKILGVDTEKVYAATFGINAVSYTHLTLPTTVSV